MPDDQHDVAPEERRVDRVAALSGGLPQRVGDLIGAGDKKQARQAPGHRCVDKTRFDRDDVDAGPVQPVAQTGQEGVKPGLGSAVGVVADPTTVARDGSDANNRAPGAVLHHRGECQQEFSRAGQAVMHG